MRAKKRETKAERKLRLSKAGKASAAKRTKEYYLRMSLLGNRAQGVGKGSRSR